MIAEPHLRVFRRPRRRQGAAEQRRAASARPPDQQARDGRNRHGGPRGRADNPARVRCLALRRIGVAFRNLLAQPLRRTFRSASTTGDPQVVNPGSNQPGTVPRRRRAAQGGPGRRHPCRHGLPRALWAPPIGHLSFGPLHPGYRFRSGTVARDRPGPRSAAPCRRVTAASHPVFRPVVDRSVAPCRFQAKVERGGRHRPRASDVSRGCRPGRSPTSPKPGSGAPVKRPPKAERPWPIPASGRRRPGKSTACVPSSASPRSGVAALPGTPLRVAGRASSRPAMSCGVTESLPAGPDAVPAPEAVVAPGRGFVRRGVRPSGTAARPRGPQPPMRRTRPGTGDALRARVAPGQSAVGAERRAGMQRGTPLATARFGRDSRARRAAHGVRRRLRPPGRARASSASTLPAAVSNASPVAIFRAGHSHVARGGRCRAGFPARTRRGSGPALRDRARTSQELSGSTPYQVIVAFRPTP